MKPLTTIFCTLLFFCSCNNEIETTDIQKESNINREYQITYPLSKTESRSNSELDTSWETVQEITLPSGEPAYTPWNSEISSKTVPNEFSMDIKKEDGWNLIAHSMNNQEKGLNYLFFYNIYRGTLKVFYYLEENFNQTTGLWHVHIDKPQNLLAFTGLYAKAINASDKIQDIYCSNITINPSKAFTKGWNCFEVDLAYDPNFEDATLYIEPCGIIESNIEISGNYNSSSEGSIITIGADKQSGVLKGTGKDAEKYLSDESSKVAWENFPSTRTLSSSISERDSESIDIGSIIKLGANFLQKVFSSEKKGKEYKLKFATQGSVTLKGDITTIVGGGFSPIAISIDKDKVGNLGVWGVEEQPTIQFNTLGRKKEVFTSGNPTFMTYGGTTPIYHIVINPDLSNKITNLKRDYETLIGTFSDSYTDKENQNSISGGMNYSAQGEHIYNDIYARIAPVFKVHFKNLNNNDTREVPPAIYLYGSKDGSGTPFGIKNNFIFGINVTFTAPDGREFMSTRSFRPLLEWRTDNLQQIYKQTAPNGHPDNFFLMYNY